MYRLLNLHQYMCAYQYAEMLWPVSPTKSHYIDLSGLIAMGASLLGTICACVQSCAHACKRTFLNGLRNWCKSAIMKLCVLMPVLVHTCNNAGLQACLNEWLSDCLHVWSSTCLCGCIQPWLFPVSVPVLACLTVAVQD